MRVRKGHAKCEEHETSRWKYKVNSSKYRSGAQKRSLSWQYKFGSPWILTEPMEANGNSRKSLSNGEQRKTQKTWDRPLRGTSTLMGGLAKEEIQKKLRRKEWSEKQRGSQRVQGHGKQRNQRKRVLKKQGASGSIEYCWGESDVRIKMASRSYCSSW